MNYCPKCGADTTPLPVKDEEHRIRFVPHTEPVIEVTTFKCPMYAHEIIQLARNHNVSMPECPVLVEMILPGKSRVILNHTQVVLSNGMVFCFGTDVVDKAYERYWEYLNRYAKETVYHDRHS